MSDEERKVLHADLDRIIDGGGDPAIIRRPDLNHLTAIAKKSLDFVEAMGEISKNILTGK